MKLRDDFAIREHVPFAATPWTPSPEPGVDRKMLERDGAEIARATSIVRYARHSSFAAHTHERGEEFVVLDGVFSDDHGDYPKGTYVRNPPGSRHRPFSHGGCTIFVKLRQFDPGDTRRCVVLPAPAAEPEVGAHAGPVTTLLHAFGSERVSLVGLAPGASTTLPENGRGAEILVLAGSMSVGPAHCETWTWLRAPRLAEPLLSASGCLFWLKQGHLTLPT